MIKPMVVIYIEKGEVVQVATDIPDLLEAIVVDLDNQQTGGRWAVGINVDPLPGNVIDQAVEEARRPMTIDEWNAAGAEFRENVRAALEQAAQLANETASALKVVEDGLGGVKIEVSLLAAKISAGYRFTTLADTAAFLMELLEGGREDR